MGNVWGDNCLEVLPAPSQGKSSADDGIMSLERDPFLNVYKMCSSV